MPLIDVKMPVMQCLLRATKERRLAGKRRRKNVLFKPADRSELYIWVGFRNTWTVSKWEDWAEKYCHHCGVVGVSGVACEPF